MSTKSTIRLTKEERRREIVEAATREFAVGGLNGTPVEAIAKRVGVSQPYLFQLFGTKKELFIAAVRRAFERTVATFRTAAAEAGDDADTKAILMAMGAGLPPPARRIARSCSCRCRPTPPATTRRCARRCARSSCGWCASCSRPPGASDDAGQRVARLRHADERRPRRWTSRTSTRTGRAMCLGDDPTSGKEAASEEARRRRRHGPAAPSLFSPYEVSDY